MEKTVCHKSPRHISSRGLKQLAKLKEMSDDDIDYSDGRRSTRDSLMRCGERKKRMFQ
jgi:hypothetical protein